jgi:hypothetical protein
MQFTGSIVKVVPAVGAVGILLLAGIMCQKPKSGATETVKQAVTATLPEHDSVTMVEKAITADMAVKKTDSATVSKEVDTSAATTVAGYYTCPMHPQIRQAKPGKCPLCGMALEFKKAAAKTNAVSHNKKKT